MSRHPFDRLPGNPAKLPRLVFLLALLVGGFLRFSGLGSKSLRGDEIETVIRARIPFPEDLHQDRIDVLKPYGSESGYTLAAASPGWYLVTHLFMTIYPTESAARLPAAVAGWLAIPLVYLLGSMLFDESVGGWAAFLLAASAFHVFYSQDARYLAMEGTLAALSLVCLAYLIRRPRYLAGWIGYTLVGAFLVYNHAIGWVVLLINIGGVAVWRVATSGRSERQASIEGRPGPHFLRNLVLATGVVFAVALPLLIPCTKVVGQLVRRASLASSGSFTLAGSVHTLWNAWFQLAGGRTVLAILAGLSLALAWRRSDRGSVLSLAVGWLALPLLGFGLLTPLTKPPLPLAVRHLMILVAPMMILAGTGVSAALEGVSVRLRGPALPVVGVLALTALLVVPPFSAYYGEQKQNWRGVAQYLRAQDPQPDQIAVTSPFRAMNLDFYLNEPERLVIVSDLAGFRALYQPPSRLCFVRVKSSADLYDRRMVDYAVREGFDSKEFPGLWSDLEVLCSGR